MLSGPAILRISVLLIIAGILAAVVQFLLPSPTPAPLPAPPQMSESPAPVQPPAPSAPAPATAPASDPVRNPATDPTPPPAADPARGGPVPPRSIAAPAAPNQIPSGILAVPSDPAPPAVSGQSPGQEAAAQAEVDMAEEGANPRAVAVVDLNTASVADLNRLRGGGAIGRAIVAKRPYASVDQLLTKRVLSRAVYERIREQVTVR